MRPRDGTASTRLGSRTVVGASASTALSAIPPFLLGSLMPFLRDELALDTTRLGFVIALYWTASTLSAVPGGRLAEAIGAKRAIVLANSLTALGLIVVGGFSRSWIHVVPAMVVAGCANGMLHPAGNLAVMRGVRLHRRGAAFGIKQSAAPVATLLAGLAIPALALTAGWRWAFLAAALPLPVIAAILPRDHPRGAPRSRGHRPSRGAPQRAQRDPGLVRLSAAAALGFGAATTLGAFLADSVVSTGGAPETAAVALMVASLACVTVRLLIGWYTDRTAEPSLAVVAGLLAAGAVGFVVLVMATTPPLWVAGAALGLGAGWGWPGLLYHVVAIAHPDAPAAATAVTTTGNAAGAALGPVIFGLVAARVSFTAAWSTSAAMLVVAALLVIGMHRAREQSIAFRGDLLH